MSRYAVVVTMVCIYEPEEDEEEDREEIETNIYADPLEFLEDKKIECSVVVLPVKRE
jgi:hypothetical protein